MQFCSAKNSSWQKHSNTHTHENLFVGGPKKSPLLLLGKHDEDGAIISLLRSVLLEGFDRTLCMFMYFVTHLVKKEVAKQGIN